MSSASDPFSELGFRPIEDTKADPFSDLGFKPFKTPSRTRSLINAPIRGLIEGGKEFTSLNPLALRGPISEEMEKKLLEEFLPVQDKATEKYLQRAGRVGTYFIGGPEGALAKAGRTAAGAGIGQLLEALGAPKWLQSIGEVSSGAIPSLGKKIPVKEGQKKVAEFLRNKGLSEQDVGLLIQDPKKLARFSKFAQKGQKTHEAINSLHESLGTLYEDLGSKSKSLGSLPERSQLNYIDNIEEFLKKRPSKIRNLVKEDLRDLYNSSFSVEDLINFDQDVNATIGNEIGGKAVLGKLKEFTADAINKISPEAAEEYKLIKDLYSKKSKVAKSLRPKDFDQLVNAGEIYGIIKGAVGGDLGLLKSILGVTGAKHLAREILINPRLQNISKRISQSIKSNKLPMARKLSNEFLEEAKKKIPEIDKLRGRDNAPNEQ
jgi:hypothetical protein